MTPNRTLNALPDNQKIKMVYQARENSIWDFTIVCFLAAVLLAVVFIFVLYPERQTYFFPRSATDFLPSGEIQEMISRTQEILTVDPENIEAHIQMGIARYQMGPEHYVKALQHMEEARRLGAVDGRIFYYAAIMYEMENLIEFAKLDYSRFLRNHPEDIEVRLRLANMLHRNGNKTEAMDHYERAGSLAADNPVVLYDIGIAYADMGMHEAARQALTRALQAGKGLPALGNYRLAKIYFALGEREKAIEYFNKELALNTDYPQLHESLAKTYEEIGDKANAYASWKRVLELSPDNTVAKQKVREFSTS